MKYFKNSAGSVCAYPQPTLDTVARIDDDSYEFTIPQSFYDIRDKLTGMTELTGAELEETLNPTPTNEQLVEQGRAERDAALRVLDEVVSNPLRFSELLEEQRLEAATYRRLLLDVPQQENFPQKYVMPEVPDFLI